MSVPVWRRFLLAMTLLSAAVAGWFTPRVFLLPSGVERVAILSIGSSVVFVILYLLCFFPSQRISVTRIGAILAVMILCFSLEERFQMQIQAHVFTFMAVVLVGSAAILMWKRLRARTQTTSKYSPIIHR